MSDSLKLARQPILDRSKTIIGYEFFFRNVDGSSDFSDPRAATASVLVNLLNQTGLQTSAGDALLFINVNAAVMQSDILLSLPTDRFVLELPADMPYTSSDRELIAVLHDKGYRFALDNARCSPDYVDAVAKVMPYVSYVKFDTTSTDIDQLGDYLKHFVGKQLIAQRVEIPEIYETYKEMGFEYFQGYFFANTSLIQHNRIDPKHLGVIKIYNLILNEASPDEIAEVLGRHNELTLQLLQYVNSTGIMEATPQTSIRSILETLGFQRLRQWLTMIIFSKSTHAITDDKSPFSLIVEQRIDIMNAIIDAIQPDDPRQMHEHARLTAFLSLMEKVLNVPMTLLLKQINTDDVIKDALIANAGPLGRIFALTLVIEKENRAAAQVLMRALGLHPGMYEQLIARKKI